MVEIREFGIVARGEGEWWREGGMVGIDREYESEHGY